MKNLGRQFTRPYLIDKGSFTSTVEHKAHVQLTKLKNFFSVILFLHFFCDTWYVLPRFYLSH